MKSLVNYAKEVRDAYEEYIKNNGVDDFAERIYNLIQNIESLTDEDKKILDDFIFDYISLERHLADVVYVNGEDSTFRSLFRMRPIRLSKSNSRIYEARNNSFGFVLKNSSRKPIKVYQRKPIK